MEQTISSLSGLSINGEQKTTKQTTTKQTTTKQTTKEQTSKFSQITTHGTDSQQSCDRIVPCVEKTMSNAASMQTTSVSRKQTTGSKPSAPEWRFMGTYEDMKKVKCRRIHAKLGSSKDLALFHEEGKFYALGAWCSHMGGPLFQGQIEDYKGSCHVMCPWHAYMFDLKSGRNDLGLEQEVFPVKVERGRVYIQHPSELSLNPYL